MATYRLLNDSKLEAKAKAGTLVYSCTGHDYGCANDDFRYTGIPHRSVTLNENGDYPFFTVPEPDLELVAEQSA